MNSGFLSNAQILEEMTSTFADIEVVSKSSSFFIARATRYGRRWILKGIKNECADDILTRQQLLKEFEILSSLSHPGIVRFSGIEEVDKLGLCIIMEWIEGPTLEVALQQGMLSRDDRRRLLLEIVEAMAYLHSRGIVHRDLKPSNIMVRQNGLTAVIIDFGLADTDAFTVVKYPAGTEGYVSERQREAATPDTSDDVYSLGVIMSSLYPEYGEIARRCKSPVGKRYVNATMLLRAIRRRSRRAYRLILSLPVVVTVCAIAMLDYHNASLRSSVDNMDIQISGLREDARRQGDELREDKRHQMAEADRLRERLSDSLTDLKSQLAEEKSYRTEIEHHNAYISDLKRQLKSKCRAVYVQYLKERKSPDFEEIYNGQKLCDSLLAANASFVARQSGLTESDRQDLEFAFSEYYGDIVKEYYNASKQ